MSVADVNVELTCCLCPSDTTIPVAVPDGWLVRHNEITEGRHVFCPEHAVVNGFVSDQCPGCVGGWGDCGLWDAFAYTSRRSLTDDDFATLRTGTCPKRTNGTFMTNNVGGKVTITDIDLSKQSTTEAGVALANAIDAYWARYPEEVR